MPYRCLPSPQDVWPRLEQRHNGTPSSQWCTDSPWTVGLTDKVVCPEWQDFTGASVTNSASMVISSPRGNDVVIPLSCRDDIMADLHGSHAGINKAMDLARTCVYWPGMEADVTDYIKWVSHMHQVQQLTSWDAETPWGPSQTLGKNRCWLLSRPFGKKAPNSGRLLQQVPICVSSGIYPSFQDHHSPEGTLCSWRRSCCCHVWQWTSLQWRRI